MDEFDQFIDLAVYQARADLIEQQKTGLQHQRPGNLQPLAAKQRKLARGQVGDVGQAAAL